MNIVYARLDLCRPASDRPTDDRQMDRMAVDFTNSVRIGLDVRQVPNKWPPNGQEQRLNRAEVLIKSGVVS